MNRHKLRRHVLEWQKIGASPKVLSWIAQGVNIRWKRKPPRRFHNGISLTNLTPEQQRFMDTELARLVRVGALEPGHVSHYVSKAFLVPKGEGKWRLVFDLRHLNKHCVDYSMKFETLKRLRHLTRKNDFMFSFDLQDGFYSLGINESCRDFFTVNIQGTLYRFAALPMGWNASPYHFCTMMDQMVRYLRGPNLQVTSVPALKPQALHGMMWKGIKILPFVDDFLVVCSDKEQALQQRAFIEDLLQRLGLSRALDKAQWEPVQTLQHLGLIVDTRLGQFRAPQAKLSTLSELSKKILRLSAQQARWVPVRLLAQLAGKAQFLYLAIPPARFFLRELHNVVSTKASWSAKVRVTKQLQRDLQWWTAIPTHHNGRPIHRAVESAYLHVDSSDYGWGAVLNNQLPARGFWATPTREEHITFKELQAVRHAVESFLPQLHGRNVLLHEDNQAVVSILTHLTSKSSALMTELRKLWYLLDTHDITLRPRYIRSAANIWADRLSREMDTSDWRFNPRYFNLLDRMWGPHTIDRFASMTNTQLPRYNSRWLDPYTEGVDALRFADSQWWQENNWCNPPWDLLPDLVLKLEQSGAAATVIAPSWPSAPWHQRLLDLSSHMMSFPPTRDLFLPAKKGGARPVGCAKWATVAFCIPRRTPVQ